MHPHRAPRAGIGDRAHHQCDHSCGIAPVGIALRAGNSALRRSNQRPAKASAHRAPAAPSACAEQKRRRKGDVFARIAIEAPPPKQNCESILRPAERLHHHRPSARAHRAAAAVRGVVPWPRSRKGRRDILPFPTHRAALLRGGRAALARRRNTCKSRKALSIQYLEHEKNFALFARNRGGKQSSSSKRRAGRHHQETWYDLD